MNDEIKLRAIEKWLDFHPEFSGIDAKRFREWIELMWDKLENQKSVGLRGGLNQEEKCRLDRFIFREGIKL